jgi:hypothetical protein
MCITELARAALIVLTGLLLTVLTRLTEFAFTISMNLFERGPCCHLKKTPYIIFKQVGYVSSGGYSHATDQVGGAKERGGGGFRCGAGGGGGGLVMRRKRKRREGKGTRGGQKPNGIHFFVCRPNMSLACQMPL